MDRTTLIIKTLERPDCLSRLLRSIRKFYPAIPILVGNDSQKPHAALLASEEWNVKFFQFEHHVGLSAGRNLLVNEVTTEYTVLLDDDFVFLPETQLEVWKEQLDSQEFDLIGGMCQNNGQDFHFVGSMRLRNHILHLKYLPSFQDPIPADIVPNFFMVRTEILRKVPWDEDLKFSEHHAFFLDCQDAGVRVGYHPGIKCDHISDRNAAYSVYRDTLAPQTYFRLFFDKYGIKEITGCVTGAA